MITPSFAITATERVLPKLALDFTTASLDPRVTFTRTTDASNPATYINSSGLVTLATNNQPRFDYDPISLICKGLLIEEQRTNLFTYSDDFANAAWGKTASSIDSNVIVSPDGTLTGDKLITNTNSAEHSVTAPALTVTSGTAYTITMYAKKAEKEFLFISFSSNGFSSPTPSYFNLTTGVATAGASVTAIMTNIGNGWYRCSATKTATSTSAGNTVLRIGLTDTNSSTTSTGANTFDGLYIWGAQLEAGAFATSYIPTTTTTLTRNADIATMTGTNFSDWYSAGVGGVVARVLPSTVSGTRPALQFDDSTANEVITLQGNTTNPELVIVDGGSPQAQIDAGTIAANTVYNLGAAWNTDNCAAAVNGGAAVTDNTATIPTVTQARLGSNGTNYLNGHIQTIRYWPQRIINAEVQAFSK